MDAIGSLELDVRDFLFNLKQWSSIQVGTLGQSLPTSQPWIASTKITILWISIDVFDVHQDTQSQYFTRASDQG